MEMVIIVMGTVVTATAATGQAMVMVMDQVAMALVATEAAENK